MDTTTIVWMVILIGAILIPFLVFANIAATKERKK